VRVVRHHGRPEDAPLTSDTALSYPTYSGPNAPWNGSRWTLGMPRWATVTDSLARYGMHVVSTFQAAEWVGPVTCQSVPERARAG
jgi:hypothetical protein